jgi:UDP-N-acetyl-D-mannosaminuronate dehydrogenase
VEGVPAAANLEEAIKEADLILLLVGHSQFKTLVPQEIKAMTAAAEVVDAVNVWDRAAWQAAGFRYLHIGDGKNN